MLAARVPERVPEREPELRRAIELPAELAHVGHAKGQTRNRPNRELARAHVPKRELVGRRRLQDLASRGPPETDAGELRRHVLHQHGAVIRRVLADPGQIMSAEGRAGNDAEAILCEPRDREVALDPAARVEHRGVGDLTDLTRDPVVADTFQERRRALARNVDLREARLVEERRALTAGAVLGSDRGRPESSRPATRPKRLVAGRGVRLEPVRPFPARLLAERGTERDQAGVGGREAKRPSGLPLVAWVLDVVVRRVDLQCARQRVVAACVVGAETARVHLPDVEPRQPVDDPLRDELSHPARACQPMRAEPGRDPEAGQLRGAEDELAVRGKGFGAVDEPDHLGLAEPRHPHERIRHQLLEPLPILREQPAVEVVRDPVQPPRRGVALVPAHHEAARLAPEVDEQGRVAHGRHVERHAVRPRDQVLVGHRDHGHVDSREPTELGGEHAARIDDDLGLDRAVVGLDSRYPPALDSETGHAGLGRDLRPAAPRALCERHRELARVDVAVGGQIRRAEHPVDGHRREKPLGFLGRDEVERQAEGLGPAGLAMQLLHPLLGRGKAERADLVPAGLEADLVSE